MNRRDWLGTLLAFSAYPIFGIAHAQIRRPRLCYIAFDPSTLENNRHGMFFQTLSSLGYTHGKTIEIDYLSSMGKSDQFPSLASECIRRKADVIVVATTPGAQAAKKATSTIPIVMLALGDPIGAGLVNSFARPEGNVTGMTFIAPALAAKRLELLKELIPRLSRVLVITYGIDPISAPQVDAIKDAAKKLGVTLTVRDVRKPEDIPMAFESSQKERVDGLITTAESFFFVNRNRFIELTAKYKLPAVFGNSQFADSGGLMSYIADFPALYAGAAGHVAKILKGAKPADLPVEQPTKFELIINLQTAKALGIAVPGTLLARADRLIE